MAYVLPSWNVKEIVKIFTQNRVAQIFIKDIKMATSLPNDDGEGVLSNFNIPCLFFFEKADHVSESGKV